MGALLFDDGTAHVTDRRYYLTKACRLEPLAPPEEDVIHKTLNAIGVKYRHRNDEILLPSRIEEERARNAVRVRFNMLPVFITFQHDKNRRRGFAKARLERHAFLAPIAHPRLKHNGLRGANIISLLRARKPSMFLSVL